MAIETPITISFPFERSFVPRGYRTPRTEWFRSEGAALIRTIESSEARLAFRVHFPPRPARNPNFKDLIPAVNLDLIHYDGEIWWPFWTWHEDFGLGDEFNLDHFRRLLEESYDICQFLPAYGPVDHDSGSAAFAREICRDDERRNLATATDRVRANFLIYAGRPYVRGGAPLYVKDWIGVRQKASVGDAGADRTISPAVGTLFSHLPERRAATFRRGDFRLANDPPRPSADALALEPTIEVLIPELVEDIRVRVRLDAIYRTAHSMFSRPPGAPRWLKKQASERLGLLAPAIGPMEDTALSNRRYDALCRLFRLGGSSYPPFSFLHQDFVGLRKQFALDVPSSRERFLGPRETMAAEDDEALARLADEPKARLRGGAAE